MDQAETAPFLLHLLGVPEATTQLAGLDPRTESATEPLLLCTSCSCGRASSTHCSSWWRTCTGVIRPHRNILPELVERLMGVPLLLLVTFRPGYRKAWMEKSYATQITLARLGPEGIGRWCKPCCTRRRAQSLCCQAWWRKSRWQSALSGRTGLGGAGAGWPASGSACHGAGRADSTYRPVASHGQAPAPDRGRHWSRGAPGSPPGHHRVSRSDPGAWPYAAPGQREFLYETHPGPARTYTFKHVLTQEAAYQSLLDSVRRQLHHRIAHILEASFQESEQSSPELLAHHYVEAVLSRQSPTGSRPASAPGSVQPMQRLSVTSPRGWRYLPHSRTRPHASNTSLALCSPPLGLVVLEAKGRGAPEVERAFARARALCQQAGETPQLFRILLGLRRYYFDRADSRPPTN